MSNLCNTKLPKVLQKQQLCSSALHCAAMYCCLECAFSKPQCMTHTTTTQYRCAKRFWSACYVLLVPRGWHAASDATLIAMLSLYVLLLAVQSILTEVLTLWLCCYRVCIHYLLCYCTHTRCVTKEAVAPVDAYGLYYSTMLSSAREKPVRYVLSNCRTYKLYHFVCTLLYDCASVWSSLIAQRCMHWLALQRCKLIRSISSVCCQSCVFCCCSKVPKVTAHSAQSNL
jgi:hypothetical protein